MAEWIVDGSPTLDLWPVDIRRFAPFHNNEKWLRDRVSEVVGMHYAMPWPNRELESGRPLRMSPFYDRLKEKGACFGSKMGWERPIWFADKGAAPENEYSYGRQNSFPNVAAECRAVRETVGVFDQTSFSKFLMQGRHAESAMQSLCANDVGVTPGRTVYTGMLNPSGGYESDVTVTRLAEEQFLIVSGSAQAIRDFDWMSRHIPPDADAYLTDVTSAYAVLGVMGPKSRDLLSRVCKTDLSNEAFPFATMQEIDIAHAPIWAVRITYVGELGWELYIPTEFGGAVYEALESAGEDVGLRDAGYYAMESLRLEKGYRAWSHELTPDVTPFEAGLAFALRLEKENSFIGRDAVCAAGADDPDRRLVMLTVDDPDPVLWGGEMILCDGEPIGDVRSGAYGHTLGRSVGSGFVKREPGQSDAEILSGRYQIEIAGERYDATPHLRAPYDPKSERVRR